MVSIRIGNDVTVVWPVMFDDGSPFPLDGKGLRLFLNSSRGRTEVMSFSVTDNVIRWTFLGKEQKMTGDYGATLLISYGNGRQITLDACGIFRLVPKSCQTTDDGEGEIGGGAVQVGSRVVTVPLYPMQLHTDAQGNIYTENDELFSDAIPKAIDRFNRLYNLIVPNVHDDTLVYKAGGDHSKVSVSSDTLVIKTDA